MKRFFGVAFMAAVIGWVAVSSSWAREDRMEGGVLEAGDVSDMPVSAPLAAPSAGVWAAGVWVTTLTDASTPEDQIVELVRAYAAERMGLDASAFQVRLATPENIGALVSAGNRVSLKEASLGGMPGRTSFAMRVQRDGRTPVTHWISADIDAVRPVVASRRSLAAEHVIGPDDLEMKTVSLSKMQDRYAFKPEEVIGKKTRRSVIQGAPISLNVVADVPVMQSGDRVTLLYEEAGFEITATGQAKGLGYVGRQVPVMNADSRRIVYGEVLDAVTVRVGTRTR